MRKPVQLETTGNHKRWQRARLATREKNAVLACLLEEVDLVFVILFLLTLLPLS